jgi:flagellar hook assembly protein FlgD
LTVYNILGQEVIRLIDREFPAGSHTAVWDGEDENGQSVASGIYLYRIEAGRQTASRKMVLMK